MEKCDWWWSTECPPTSPTWKEQIVRSRPYCTLQPLGCQCHQRGAYAVIVICKIIGWINGDSSADRERLSSFGEKDKQTWQFPQYLFKAHPISWNYQSVRVCGLLAKFNLKFKLTWKHPTKNQQDISRLKNAYCKGLKMLKVSFLAIPWRLDAKKYQDIICAKEPPELYGPAGGWHLPADGASEAAFWCF